MPDTAKPAATDETDPFVDLDKSTTLERTSKGSINVASSQPLATDAEPVVSDELTVVFDRNVAGGHEEGDRVTVTRTAFVDGLIASGVAHETTDADDLVVVTDAGPVAPPAA